MAQSANFIKQLNQISYYRMAEKNIVPNLEAKATDGNPVFTPRQWLERFRQFCKREHKIDIAPLLKREDVTDTGWTEKDQITQEDFLWGVGPEALYQITMAEYKTEPDSIKVKDLIRLFTEFYMSKRNTYHDRGDFFWAKQTEEETPEEFWRRLIEIEKECNFNTISAEELLISKYMTACTDKKLRDKIMKEKTLDLKKVNKLIKRNTYEKKNKKNTIPEALISTKEKQIIKDEPIQRMERFGTRPKNENFGNRICRFCTAPNWTPMHKCPALDAYCNKCGKKGHYAKTCSQKTNNRTVKRLTEDESNESDRSSSESEESIHHTKKIKKIDETNKHFTTMLKINEVTKEFIIDTGSPKSLMPPDERITKSTEIQKITNRKQDKNKNEVKFKEKIPVNVEYENNKQKMETLITERTDMTPLLGIDWMKKFKLTISKIQLADNNQSEHEKVFNKFPDLFENIETIKDTEINIQLKPGHYPVKQKARPIPLHLQEGVGRELEKSIKSGHLEKIKDVDEDCFVSPVVITLKSDKSVKIALDSGKLNDCCIKMRPHMPSMEELLYQFSVEISRDRTVQPFISKIDLDYAYGQLKLSKETSQQCVFALTGEKLGGYYQFKKGFYGLADIPTIIQEKITGRSNIAHRRGWMIKL